MAKYIAQMVVAGMQIVGRAFIKAVQTEMRSSQQAAQARSSSDKTNMRSAATDALSGMTLQEAKQILHVDDIRDIETVAKKYEHLFSVNDKAKGGSFYIQSKVFRAKERIDQEVQQHKSTSDKNSSENSRTEDRTS